MISAILSRVVILLFGTLYPAYASYKAVRTKNVKEYVKWMMYWIVFALFTCAETFTDLFFSFWFPFYYEIKVVLVLWLLSPATKGSSILYRNFVHPALAKREPEIDEYINKAKEQGYHTMIQLGSKGVSYATNVIVQTAMKGGGGIVNHIRRSYSLCDLSSDLDTKADLNCNSRDIVDSAHVPRDLRLKAQRKQQVGSHIDLYFPEMNVDFRTHPHELPVSLSQIRSSEDVSLGYSSGDPLFAEGQAPSEGGNPLMRTASVGGMRARTTRNARTTTSQSKKPPTAEEEDEGGLTDNYGWPQAFPFPVTSMYSEILSPLGLSPQALLNPQVLEMMLNDSFYNSQLPVNICEVSEEQKNNIDVVEEEKRKLEYFEAFEHQNILDTSNKTPESAQEVSLNTGKNNKLKECEVQVSCTIDEGESEEPKPSFHSHNLPQSENVVCEVLSKELNISSQKIDDLYTSVDITSSITINAVDGGEKEDKRTSDCFEDANDVEVSTTDFSERKEDSSSKDHITSSTGIGGKLLEDSDKEKKVVSECFEDATDADISTGNFFEKEENITSKDCIPPSSSDTNDLLFENSEKEKNRISECFEDATDIEILLCNSLDKKDLLSPEDDVTNRIQRESSNRTTSNVSLASSNEQCFEDSLPDLTDVSCSGSLDLNNRKGKYKKKHAPPPPEVRRSAELELLQKAPSNNELKNEMNKSNLLIESHSLSGKSFIPEPSAADKTFNLNKEDVYQITEKKNVTSQNVEKINVPPTYNFRESSPSPSQKSKKDQSNFSRFLPRASISSLFNMWGSKEGSTKSKSSLNHSSSGTSYVPNAPSNLESNIKYVPDISGGSSKKEDNLSKSTPKLKIRQMSHSPSRRKHHEYE